MPDERTVPTNIIERLKDWDHTARRLRILTIGLAVVSIVFSILVASEVLPDDVQRGAAICAAIATALLTGLGLTQKSNAARNAWRHLNAEVMRYQDRVESDDAKAKGALYGAYEKGETLMGDVAISANVGK
jgi:hypothetical protein